MSPYVSTPGKAALALGMLLVTACGFGGGSAKNSPPAKSPTPSASASPSSSAVASPQPVVGDFGVLVGSQAASTYTVSIVGLDGKVVASADASTPAQASCGANAGANLPPPVSTSDSRAYFMDAQGAVHYLTPGGQSGTVTSVPAATASQRSMFAVSPDDTQIAVVFDKYTASGATTNLYVYSLSTSFGAHTPLYSSTGLTTLWPTGWHGTNNLVVAKVNACTQGGGPLCCSPIELHVVDPATATRRFILGGPNCHIAGSPTPGGVACVDTTFTKASVLNWTAGTVTSYAVSQGALVYLSPNGSLVAVVSNAGTQIMPSSRPPVTDVIACAWIDDSNVLSGGDQQHQPRILNVTTGAEVPVAAEGDCAGRIPGSL